MTAKKAFTLIELMVVIAILGILIGLAMPMYEKYMLTAKTAEAKTNIGAIMTCENSYAAIEEKYLTEQYYPTGTPGVSPRVWDINNSGNFRIIGFQPAGKVYYSYGIASGDVSSDPANANPAHGEVIPTYGADITVIAKGDLDGDGNFGYFCTTDLLYPQIKSSIEDF
jgi:type IV pilus assembly protein PilA